MCNVDFLVFKSLFKTILIHFVGLYQGQQWIQKTVASFEIFGISRMTEWQSHLKPILGHSV